MDDKRLAFERGKEPGIRFQTYNSSVPFKRATNLALYTAINVFCAQLANDMYYSKLNTSMVAGIHNFFRCIETGNEKIPPILFPQNGTSRFM